MEYAPETGRSSTPAGELDRERRDAVHEAIRRCPEHASALHRLEESAWAVQLYDEARAQMTRRYDKLVGEYICLKRACEEEVDAAVGSVNLVTLMERFVDRWVNELKEVHTALGHASADPGGELSRVVAESEIRVSCLATQLGNVVRALSGSVRLSVQPGGGQSSDVPIMFAHRTESPADMPPADQTSRPSAF